MGTLTADKLGNTADNLVELVELLEKIKINPEKAEANKISMTAPDGTVITY